MADIRYFSIRQFDTYSIVYQITRTEEEQDLVQSVSLGNNAKNIRSVLNSYARRLNMLRRGRVEERDVVEAQLDGILGESIGPLSDLGLGALGIGSGPKPKEK